MHIYKRKDSKYYWYKFEYLGAVYRGSTGVKAKPAARDITSKIRLDVIEGRYGIKRQKATATFKTAMAQFLDHVRQQHADHPNTAKRYEAASKPLIATFGAKQLHTITREDVEKYKTARLKQGSNGKQLKPATVNADLACMRAMFTYFVALDVVVKNPVSRVKLPPPNNEKMRVLSFEEERLYLAACPQPHQDVAVLMLDAGFRPDEIYRMKCKNVNLEAGYVFNPYGKTKSARRKLSLTRRAADVLMARLGGEYVFPHKDDPAKPMARISYMHTLAVETAGVPHFRLYDLRHTFATRAVESGVDLVTLAALLGHSKIQMVLRYAHPTEEHQVLAIRKMEEFTIARQMAEASASTLIQ
jgi:integrase